MVNYKQIYAIKKANEQRILKCDSSITNESGIYRFFRFDKEKNKICIYIGQALHCLDRLSSHLSGYKTKNPSHIDKSLFKHKLISEKQEGWIVEVICYCPKEQLNQLERAYINMFREMDSYEVYNVTGGGQDKGKFDINERNNSKLKSYKNGKIKAKNKVLSEIRVYFDKYLDFVIKGETNKIKERKLKEFEELLKGGENED